LLFYICILRDENPHDAKHLYAGLTPKEPQSESAPSPIFFIRHSMNSFRDLECFCYFSLEHFNIFCSAHLPSSGLRIIKSACFTLKKYVFSSFSLLTARISQTTLIFAI